MKILAANWKMNMTSIEAKSFSKKFKKLCPKNDNKIFICAPFTTISAVKKYLGKRVVVGAENVSEFEKGAYTGEVSANMILDAGASAVIIGHSERRNIFGESDSVVNAKIKTALSKALTVIFCIGEKLENRECGKTNSVLEKQIKNGLKDVQKFNDIIVAYEPVWAIGTGKTASIEQIAETHAFIRKQLEKLSKTTMPILYGGSANEKNCKEILSVPNVDGALIGGASLVPEKFCDMIRVEL